MNTSRASEHFGYMKDSRMSLHRKSGETVLGLALIGAGVSASVWLLGRWHKREQRWRWAREASRGLALKASTLSLSDQETTPNESNEAETWSTK
jgi:hypothetical protein